MRILQGNKFLFRRDGVTTVLEETMLGLQARGHKVHLFGQAGPDNLSGDHPQCEVPPVFFDDRTGGLRSKGAALARMLTGFGALRRLKQFLAETPIDLAHLHNIYHHLSPRIIGVLKRRGIPVVMTLHDYKLFCPAYLFLRARRPCTYCLRHGPFGVLRHRCMRGSMVNGLIGWLEARLARRHYSQVDRFVVPSDFMAQKARQAGIPPNRITLLRNPAPPIPASIAHDDRKASPFRVPPILFLGRLYPEKGVEALLQALAYLGNERVKLVVAGEGPEKSRLVDMARRLDLPVTFPGFIDGEARFRAIANAMAVVFPSQWYENCPLTLIEAFAMGKPVIATGIGGIPELVQHGKNGWLVPPGDVSALAAAMQDLYDHEAKSRAAGAWAKKWVTGHLSRAAYCEGLEGVYSDLLGISRVKS